MYISDITLNYFNDHYELDLKACTDDYWEVRELGYWHRKHVKLSAHKMPPKNESTDRMAIKKLPTEPTEWIKDLNKNANSSPEFKVKKVIFSKPATIIFWSDGTKTVVKCGKDDTYDKEKGFYIACAKKLFGNDYRAVGRMNKALTMAETKGV